MANGLFAAVLREARRRPDKSASPPRGPTELLELIASISEESVPRGSVDVNKRVKELATAALPVNPARAGIPSSAGIVDPADFLEGTSKSSFMHIKHRVLNPPSQLYHSPLLLYGLP